MFKIVFVVAVFAFALQGALSSPVAENEAPAAQQPNSQPDVSKAADPAVKKPNEEAPVTAATSTEATSTTAAPKSGASSTEMCLLLVQVSSLALVAKHMLL